MDGVHEVAIGGAEHRFESDSLVVLQIAIEYIMTMIFEFEIHHSAIVDYDESRRLSSYLPNLNSSSLDAVGKTTLCSRAAIDCDRPGTVESSGGCDNKKCTY
jgi:hypothetical protein